MRFLAPEWFMFLPVLAFAGWYWRRLELWRPLRLGLLLLVVLTLARPELRILGQGLDVWVLVDRSASAADLLQPRLPEWKALLEGGRRSEDRLRFVDFANEAIEQGVSDHQVFSGNDQHTRLALAVRHALSQRDRDRASRILVLSDGYSTEPLGGLAEQLVDRQVPLDIRLLSASEPGDVQVVSMKMPSRVQVAEPYLVEVAVRGTPDQSVPYELYRNEERAGHGVIELQGGQAVLRFTDRVASPGGYRYRVVLLPLEDRHSGNNAGENWIEVAGGPRILLATGYADDPLADVLRRQGFEVEEESDLARLSVGRLSGASAVILNNVPAYLVPTEFLKAIPFFVRVQGGGLLMTGGQFSFGSGGYFESAIDPLLPVSMDLREEDRKLSVALAIVMDRSGSMGMGVAGGRTKMDLANEGAGRAIELLGSQDSITVFAVDSKAHPVIELTTVGGRRQELAGLVRRVQSGGGGIYVYNGLAAAWDQLQQAGTGQRHVILFADAADAEQPDQYKSLIGDMVDRQTTVSVIGLGTDADADAAFLKDIAVRGGGRIFFNADPSDLPALFAQEAVTVARSAFVEEPVPVEDAGGWLELAARPMSWPASVDGYNLSYLRPAATAAALSGDEYAAPMVAFWRRGLGRSAAVSFAVGGEFSETVRAWDKYGDFQQTLARWLMGEEVPPGVGLRTRLDGTSLFIDLLYDERWEEKIAARPPEIVIDHGDGLPRPATWQRLSPGHYRSAVPLEARATVRGAVQMGGAVLPFGPVTAGLNAEWAFDGDRIEALKNVVRVSGGEERLDLSTVWEAPRQAAFRDVRPWLYLALLIGVLLEALTTRMGWGLPVFAPSRAPVVPVAPPPEIEKAAPMSEETVVPASEESDRRRERFARAKRRGD